MKRKRCLKTIVMASFTLFVLSLSGCALTAEFEGTWIVTIVDVTITMTFGQTSAEWVYTGGLVGDVTFSVESYDEAADHIALKVTSSTGGAVPSFPVGGYRFILYSINGNEMYIGISDITYPATTDMGPCMKL